MADFYASAQSTAPTETIFESPFPFALTPDAAMQALSDRVRSGHPWPEALLDAIAMWTLPEETVDGRHFRYVINGEAFDWLLLAERLWPALGDAPTIEESEELLFRGRFPTTISADYARSVLGHNKFRGVQNYWYGVVVEEALQTVVEEETRKAMRASGRVDIEDISGAVFCRIYDDDPESLLKQFAKESGLGRSRRLSLTRHKEFLYWLFKRRLKYWDPARVASDFRKGLNYLQCIRGSSEAFG